MSRAASPTPPDVLLVGATGLVGRELLRVLTEPGRVRKLHLLLRRESTAAWPQQVVPHVIDFAALPRLPAVRDAYCALGTTIRSAGSKQAFRAVDFDAVLNLARAARKAGARRFAVVSALGADARSPVFYNRVKGEMEAAIGALGFDGVIIARPSLLAGDRAALGQPTRLAERLSLALSAPFTPLLPKALRPIEAATVARAMVRAMNEAPKGVRIVDSAQLQTLGA